MQETETTAPCCAGLSGKINELGECFAKTIRQSPGQAATYAFIGGILLAVFPVGRILGGLVKLGFALIRPALLLLGVVKLFETIERRDP